MPTRESFLVELNEHSNLSNEAFATAVDIAQNLFDGDEVDEKWLLENTEKWCQDRAIYNAVMESISIIDGKHESLTKNALPDLLQTALGVAFDTNVGHDYVENAEERLISIIKKKIEYPLTWIISIKLLKAEFRTKPLISALLVLVSVNHCLCVTRPQLLLQIKRMFYTLQWKWQKNVSQNVSMQTYLIFLLIN